MSDTYNGWRNYATWRVNLEVIDDYVSQTVYDDEETARRWGRELGLNELADELKDYADEVIFESQGFNADNYPLACSYADAFLSDVDWYEIAEHAREQANEAIEFAESEA